MFIDVTLNKYNLYVLFQITWVVGFFTESKQYSVIPCNWLIKPIENDTSITFCKWPPFAVTSAHLQEAQNPMTDWEIFRLKVLNDNKTFGKILILNNIVSINVLKHLNCIEIYEFKV